MRSAEQAIDTFFRDYPSLHFVPREILIRPGDESSGISYLAEGTVRMFATSVAGEELTLHLFRAGTFFPMLWQGEEQPSPYYFEAVNSIEVFRAPTEEVLGFLQSYPEALWSFTSRLMAGLRGTTERMSELVFGDSYGKTVSVLRYLARTYGEMRGKRCFIDYPLTHETISTWVGSTRVSVSQAMSRLKKEGRISYEKGHVVILDGRDFESFEHKLP